MDKLYEEIKKTVDSYLNDDSSFVLTVYFLRTRFRLGEHRALGYIVKLKQDGYKITND